MKKFHQKLFWLLVLLLPVQLGKHFWPEGSYVLGLRVDYLSPTAYLTDLLVLGILVFWFWERRKQLRVSLFKKVIKQYWWVLAIFTYLLVNALLAYNPGAGFYKFLKVVELSFLGFYVAKNQRTLWLAAEALPWAIIYSSLIAIGQFLKQTSLGGLFWWLGERTFTSATPGIAQAIVNGQLLMRPYATFPHPNVLAGFLLVAMILISRTQQRQRIFRWLTMTLGVTALVLSFSRSAWLVGLVAGLWLTAKSLWQVKSKRKTLLWLTGCLLIALGVFFYFTPRLSTEEAVNQRVELIKVAVTMVQASPLAGVGLNNFIVRLPEFWQTLGLTYWLQPVHNLYLLLAAEIGMVGLIVFLWFLILSLKRLLMVKDWSLLVSLLVILLIGMVDHYWLTLQQPQLLFALVLGWSWAKVE